MMDISILIASVLAASPPILFAVLGETITEKAGVINLSLDGSMLLAALVGFIVALHTDSVLLGFCAGMATGAFIACIIAFVATPPAQVATGFVTLLSRDLAYVLGILMPMFGTSGFTYSIAALSISRLSGRSCLIRIPWSISVSCDFPGMVYMHKTRSGLNLQGLGERPAAFVRGVNVTVMRYVYTVVGGALVGLGGASFSLMVKPGWARPYGIEGTGWIALAIVIFGGWQPVRAALGAYFFVALQTAANLLQSVMPNIPTQLFSTLPFPLMILTLLLVTLGNAEWTNRVLSHLPQGMQRFLVRTLKALQTVPPASLGTLFRKE
jgi:simple sugar transport system permease protein